MPKPSVPDKKRVQKDLDRTPQHKGNYFSRYLKYVSVVVVTFIVLIEFGADLTTILDYLNKHAELKKSPSFNEVKNDLLDFSDKTFLDPNLMNEVNNITRMKNNCIKVYSIYDKKRASCLTYVGQSYESLFQYTNALDCLEEANEIDPKISDPYFALGNIYYDLAIVDLIERGRYDIYPSNLSFFLYPDEKSKVLFNKTIEEYNHGENYDLNYYDLNLSSIYLISWTMKTYRKQQIKDVLSGFSYISANNKSYEILNCAYMAMIIHPKDKNVRDKCWNLIHNSLIYMMKSPEEFSGIPFSSYHDEKGSYRNFNQ